MMDIRRVSLFAGHYGSGKTNIAVNFALKLHRDGIRTAIYDLDIVNPYFRTKDSQELLEQAGIRLIASPYANSNVDIPALPSEMYRAVDDRDTNAILDIGGDDRGATALGRLRDAILAENNYHMYFVANFYRPLTTCVPDMIEVMREVEAAGGIPFTAIVNNSNLGEITEAEDVIATGEKADALSKATGLPVAFTTARDTLSDAVAEKIQNVLPLHLQEKYY